MATVDPVFAQWLMADGLWHVAEDAVLRGRWGDRALNTSRMTTIAQRSDAEAEAARQLAFMGPVAAIDVHMLPGRWRQYRGRVITITADKLGYDAGVDVFVLGAEDEEANGLSRVTVLRRL